MALEDFHREYCPPRFPRATTARARQKIAAKFDLPLIYAGRGNTLIDADEGDECLKEHAERANGTLRRGPKPRVAKPINPSQKQRVVTRNARGRITGRVEPITRPTG